MTTTPRKASDDTCGMRYFARMIEKIRLDKKGELRPDFHKNLGKGLDARCCDFLRVECDTLKKRVLEGGGDEEILEWCYTNGRRLNEVDLFIWNSFRFQTGLE